MTVMQEPETELIDHVHHEHTHLNRLFEDLEATFERLARDGVSDGGRDREVLEVAADDLQAALDEMLHHFDHEEELFFVAIESRFPEHAEEIAELVASHEVMYAKTRELQRVVRGPLAELEARADEILETVRQLRHLIDEHNTQEHELFDRTLSQLDRDERQALLRRARHL
jgi:hemerythrin-like domain-containing protein